MVICYGLITLIINQILLLENKLKVSTTKGISVNYRYCCILLTFMQSEHCLLKMIMSLV